MHELDGLAKEVQEGKAALPQGWEIERSTIVPGLTLRRSIPPFLSFEGLETVLMLKVRKGWGGELRGLAGYGRYELPTPLYQSGLTLQLEAANIHPLELIDYMESVEPGKPSQWQSLRDTWQELKTSRYWEKDEYRDASRYRICELVQTYIELRLLEARVKWYNSLTAKSKQLL
jgi:hypothetical protein